MKKQILSFLAAFAVAGTSFAGTEATSKEYKQPVVPVSCFKDFETTVDLFYSYNDGINTGGREKYYHDRSGGGVAATYWFYRYFGAGLEGNWFDGAPNKDVINEATAQLFVRYPVELGGFCFAPYIFGGGGGTWNGTSAGIGDVGTGIEYRFTPNIGIFADWRYVFAGHNFNYFDTSRAGLRFIF